MSSSRDPQRLRQGLVPLTTTALGPGSYHAQLNTPISAVSMASSHLQSAGQTPSSSIQPYNPQQWMPSPGVGGAERVQMMSPENQVSAPPPPPYSPPRSQGQPRPMSGIFDHGSTSTSTPPPRVSMTAAHRPSPEPQTNRSFPPPPGAAGRGGSRERRFGLPSLTRRREHDSSSPDLHHTMPMSRQSMGGSIPFHMPESEVPSLPAVQYNFSSPPASRRAASTGAIDTPTSARSRSTSQTRWEPGMPLPPPPPGPPPPAGSRSQSVQPLDRNAVPIISPPTRRRPPSHVSTLGPVPPTPANWEDTPSQSQQMDQRLSPEPSIEGSSVDSLSHAADPVALSSANSLNRTGAVRGDKTILQRRTESRTRHQPRGSIDERANTQPISDIVVSNNAEGIAARHMLSRTPRSAGTDVPRTGDSHGLQDSRNSTPRALGSAKLPQIDTATPPFSPYPAKQGQPSNSQSVAPKALPTPPPNVRSASSSRPRDGSRPPTSAGTSVSKNLAVNLSAEQFAAGAVERFQAFADKESAASTDGDRVRLFADFIVNESRIRRERYSSAIGAMGSEIFDLTRDLFRPMTNPRRESGASQEEWTPQSSEPNRSHRGSVGSAAGPSNSAPGSAGVPVSPSGGPPNVNWNSNYMPSLSPILSMSVSDNYENGSSRGRPPSRWWESSSQGDPSNRLERSKRESKYMGVPKDQWVDADGGAGALTISEEGSSSAYPPEKVGLHEQEQESSTPQPLRFTYTPVASSPSPAPHNPESLDVSRLVTMPPPYPRHHPAVNNSHPELTSIRATVRSLSDMAHLNEAKEKFARESSERREGLAKSAAERRQSLRANLQQEINSGNLNYADAAAIESSTQEEENDKKKECEKKEYEFFQSEVILPLNDLLTTRITRATELLEDLSRHLFDSGRNDADMPQEEGDDRPELLEKLTLLKWIFEARETLHRAIYDLLSDRNYRYREVVITPYRLAGNAEKIKSAEAFFAEDATKREYGFANEVLNRARDFRTVMEEAVEHGVALQLSAFWDIAPPLCRLLDSIPADIEGFNVQIPQAELDENPSYRAHPLQYLFSLLLHAEKSTHQFIEAHTNLLCLLHEVKEAVVHAKAKVLASQTADADGTPLCSEEREERAQAMRWAEERRLTEDLKEKVRTVQDQWTSALGEGLKSVKERTGEWLLQTGGWDETLEEGGVGSV